MRRQSYRAYLFLVFFLFLILSIPEKRSEALRSKVIAAITPTWQGLHFLKTSFFKLLVMAPPTHSFTHVDQKIELEKLQAENLSLKRQIENMREWLLFEDRIDDQLEKLKALGKNIPDDIFWKAFFQRRSEELCLSLDLQIQSLPAKVIFREPDSWSSAFWLNVGEKDNEALGRRLVAINSPVIIGASIVGVVEQVGYKQCKVRLITDPSLIPSVRAIRGSRQNQYLHERMEEMISAIELREDLFSSEEVQRNVLSSLYHLKNALSQSAPDRFLAKGELHGTVTPLWRSRSHTLKGVGFNYDFPDVEGPARDLRTGEMSHTFNKLAAESILKVGDLLITTGYDGVFPAGLEVGIVSKVERLREGACSYELEARLTAGNLDELSHFLVLPPIGFEK